MMRVRGLLTTGFVTLGVLAGGLVLAAAPALAAPHRVFSRSLETPAGGFGDPVGLGAGPKGELFVANLASKVVDVYDPGSSPEAVYEFAVAGATGDLYQLAVDDATATASEVDVYVASLGGSVVEYAYDPETKTAAEVRSISAGLTEPTAVATDSAGDVYVADFPGGYVNKYSSTGTLIKEKLIEGLNHPESIAVDAAGNIYVASAGGAFECSNTGSCAAFGGAEVAKPDNGVTIGPEGDVYISVEGSEIFVFEPDGTLVESFDPAHPINNAYGLGVIGTSVYATNIAGEVAVFALPQPLTAETKAASEVSTTTAKLHGEVALEGGGTIHYHFDYGNTTAYGSETPEAEVTVTSGSDEAQVSAEIENLDPSTTYDYKIVATDTAAESAEGVNETLSTQAVPPTVVTGGVLSETPGVAPSTTASIGGEVNPEGLDTHYYVQYGAEGEEYSQSAPFLPLGVPLPQGIDAGSGSESVVLGGEGAPPGVSLEGLTPGTVYRYRLVAYNSAGTSYGAPRTVTVLPAPEVGPASVSEITQESATITTSVNPEGLHTLYDLDVGTSTAYGTPYPGDAGSGSGAVALAFHLSGLHAGDTYHFRLTASNSNGTSTEEDQTFTTLAGAQGFVPVFTVTPSLPPLAFTAVAFPAETGTTATTTTTKGLTRAQKLKDALKQCKKDKAKSKRTACEKAAKKKYGADAKKKK